jgi:hypothetical protein
MATLGRIDFGKFFTLYYDRNNDVVLNTKKKYYHGVNAAFEIAFRDEVFLDRFDESRSNRQTTHFVG